MPAYPFPQVICYNSCPLTLRDDDPRLEAIQDIWNFSYLPFTTVTSWDEATMPGFHPVSYLASFVVFPVCLLHYECHLHFMRFPCFLLNVGQVKVYYLALNYSVMSSTSRKLLLIPLTHQALKTDFSPSDMWSSLRLLVFNHLVLLNSAFKCIFIY